MSLTYGDEIDPVGERSNNTDWMNLEPGDFTSDLSYFAGGWVKDRSNPFEANVGIWLGEETESGEYILECSEEPPEDAVYVIEQIIDDEVENLRFASSEKEAFNKGKQEMKIVEQKLNSV